MQYWSLVWHLQQLVVFNQFKIKIAKRWCYSDDIAQGFFPVQCSLESLGQHSQDRVFACGMLSQEYFDIIEQGFFMCSVVWSLLDNIAQGFYLCCNVVPRVLRQHWTGFFSCNGVWRTLHKVFTCVMLFQRVLRQHWRKFFPFIQCCLEASGQHCTRLLPVQCCPKRIKMTLNRIFSCAMLSGASRTTLRLGCLLVQHCPKSNKATLNRTSWAKHCTRFLPVAMLAHG